jgi:hypothetical protein
MSRVSASLASYSVPRVLARVAPFGSYVAQPPSSWTDYDANVLSALLFTWGVTMDGVLHLGPYKKIFV